MIIISMKYKLGFFIYLGRGKCSGNIRNKDLLCFRNILQTGSSGDTGITGPKGLFHDLYISCYEYMRYQVFWEIRVLKDQKVQKG